MDRNLVTNYGLLLIVSLTMAVLLAMATPFGDYIGESYVAYIKMAKKGMDQEINHGYEDNMEYFDEMMNKDIFVVYIEAGLYSGSRLRPDLDHTGTPLSDLPQV